MRISSIRIYFWRLNVFFHASLFYYPFHSGFISWLFDSVSVLARETEWKQINQLIEITGIGIRSWLGLFVFINWFRHSSTNKSRNLINSNNQAAMWKLQIDAAFINYRNKLINQTECLQFRLNQCGNYELAAASIFFSSNLVVLLWAGWLLNSICLICRIQNESTTAIKQIENSASHIVTFELLLSFIYFRLLI